MKNMKKIIAGLLALMLILTGCGKNSGKKDDKKGNEGSEKKKVAVVINQKFGDNGPMDDLAKGADRAAKDFGVEIKKLESESASKFEEDIRAMSKDYDMVVTTFPYMSDATAMIAKEFPDTKYAAIFQFINNENTKIDNVWDTEFHGEQAFFINGYIAGKLTKSNKIGMIVGGEEPTPNAEGNGFMRGVKKANPDAQVEFAYVGSYEDPAKAKEIALAMIGKGCDILQTDSGSSNAGVVDAAKEKNALVSGEITDFYDTYDGFFGIIGIGFGDTLYKGVEAMMKNEFHGGKHEVRGLDNGGYFMDWASYERFAKNAKDNQELVTKVIEEAKELEKSITKGDIKIPFDTEVPSWDRIKQGE